MQPYKTVRYGVFSQNTLNPSRFCDDTLGYIGLLAQNNLKSEFFRRFHTLPLHSRILLRLQANRKGTANARCGGDVYRISKPVTDLAAEVQPNPGGVLMDRCV